MHTRELVPIDNAAIKISGISKAKVPLLESTWIGRSVARHKSRKDFQQPWSRSGSVILFSISCCMQSL